MENARYEIAVMNGTNGAMETIYCNDTTVIGGYFCDLDRAQHAYFRGEQVAFGYDREKGERFYLRGITW